MKQLGHGCPDNAEPKLADPQAEVDVVESDGKLRLIQTAHSLENLAPECQAGSGNCRNLARQGELAQITGVVP